MRILPAGGESRIELLSSCDDVTLPRTTLPRNTALRTSMLGLCLMGMVCGCANPTLLAPAQSGDLRELLPAHAGERPEGSEPPIAPESIDRPPQVALGDPAIGELDADITLPGDIAPPQDLAAPVFARYGEEHYQPSGMTNALSDANWQGGAFCHRPLYFEEYYLEREGRSWGVLQPAVSGAHFFATVPMMPYLMTIDPPGRCSYLAGVGPLGEPLSYRRQLSRPRLSGALVEAGLITGMVFILP